MDREVAERKEKLRDLYVDNQPSFLECVERLKPLQREVKRDGKVNISTRR